MIHELTSQDGAVVAVVAVDVAGAGAAVAADAAGLLDAAAAAVAKVADEPAVVDAVVHTHQPMDSFPAAVGAAAALQTQAQYPTPVAAVASAVDRDLDQAEPHTQDTSGKAAGAGRTDYAEVALVAEPVDASCMALVVHTAQAGVAGKVVEAAAIPSVRGTTRNNRKRRTAR